MTSRHVLTLGTFELGALILFAAISPAHAAANTCDRDCLKKLADSYVAAMVAHDPAKVPLARDVKMVENIQRIRPGEGLWKTATAAPTTFRIYVPDTVAQQVGYMAVMQEDGKPIQLALRLKLEGGTHHRGRTRRRTLGSTKRISRTCRRRAHHWSALFPMPGAIHAHDCCRSAPPITTRSI